MASLTNDASCLRVDRRHHTQNPAHNKAPNCLKPFILLQTQTYSWKEPNDTMDKLEQGDFDNYRLDKK